MDTHYRSLGRVGRQLISAHAVMLRLFAYHEGGEQGGPEEGGGTDER